MARPRKPPASVMGAVKGPTPPKNDAGAYKTEHSQYWDLALNEALRAAKQEWGRGSYQVVVHQYARVSVRNPGSIGEYRVVLTPVP